MTKPQQKHHESFFGASFAILKQTAQEWVEDKAPQLGAALAYYTVFSLAPLILVLLAIVGFIFRDDPAGAWSKMTEQMSYFLDQSAVHTVQEIAQNAAQPGKGLLATIVGIALAIFGASGVFGQLQDALNTIWGVKPKPGGGLAGFLRTRFLSFAMVGGICFLMLVSLTLESVLKGFSHYVQSVMPGGIVVALATYWIFDLGVSFSFSLASLSSCLTLKFSGVMCGWALLSRHFSLPSVSWPLAFILGAAARPRPTERPARSSRSCSGSITLRKFCSLAQSLPRSMPLTLAARLRRTTTLYA